MDNSKIAEIVGRLLTTIYKIRKDVEQDLPKIGDAEINAKANELLKICAEFDSEYLTTERIIENIDAITNLMSEVKDKITLISTNRLFNLIRQGTATNKLTKLRTRKTDKPDAFSGILKINRENFTLAIMNFAKTIGLRTSAHQLLDALIQEATRNGMKSPNVTIPIRDFMNMRGLTDEKEAHKQVEADLEVIFNARISFTEKRGKSNRNFLDMRLIDKKGIHNGVIGVSFVSDFIELLKTYKPMPYPNLLQMLDNKHNPHSYYFGRKISEHKNMNYGEPNEDIISVETLLNSSPFMPSYEEVANTDRHYKDRIIKPFEHDMDALSEILTWHYCKSKGELLTDEEAEKTDKYDIFIKLLVKITWHNYPKRALPEPKPKRKKKESPPIAL